jgi:predicted aspartyl protease
MGLHRLPNGTVTDEPNDEIMSKAFRHFAIALVLIIPSSAFGSVKAAWTTQLSGYKAVRVHYSPLNKMIMSARINGQRANLLVDTGSNQVILNAAAAASFGIGPQYIRLTQINGQQLPVGFAQNLSAGNMSFGSLLVALRNSNHSEGGNAHVDGVLGLDVLSRYKAVINCHTKLIFFKVDRTRQMHLSGVAASEKFTRVPLRREENGAVTAPCSIRGQSARLLVDTGSFVTTFAEPVFQALGIGFQSTHLSAHFPSGTTRKVSTARINDLKIGDFKVPPGKFGVAALPNFALRQGNSRMFGILGMDTLYNCHAIIDLDDMNLFLK